jgi:hypothetical protein
MYRTDRGMLSDTIDDRGGGRVIPRIAAKRDRCRSPPRRSRAK